MAILPVESANLYSNLAKYVTKVFASISILGRCQQFENLKNKLSNILGIVPALGHTE